ncbi:MAG: DNA recombination protein RmuC [Candidatus Dojkabacteria bacterium]|nr:DNA recombination protein RmuC [Candidatus Dojkabacteria bacterium]
MEIILIAVVSVQFLALIYFGNKILNKKQDNNDSDKELAIIKEQLRNLSESQGDKIDKTRIELSKLLQDQLNNSQKTIQQQFAISQKSMSETNKLTSDIVKEVTEKLTKLDDTNKQVVGFAEQLQSLENILKNPKQRGILGEYFLESVLKNVMPPGSFEMQYKFKNGEIVDAAIFIGKDADRKIIPVDSKFSLENYNKIVAENDPLEKEKLEKQFKTDLKNRIEETSKYIRPDEGTMDFAFMFIPSEGIYYDLLVNQVGAVKVNTRDLIQYAFAEKNVIIVSPTSFLAYLQTVLQGLRALKIEESAKVILENVRKLKNHMNAYEENFEKVGKHLGTTVNTYNKAHKELGKIDKDFMNITGEKMDIISEEVEENPLSLI